MKWQMKILLLALGLLFPLSSWSQLGGGDAGVQIDTPDRNVQIQRGENRQQQVQRPDDMNVPQADLGLEEPNVLRPEDMVPVGNRGDCGSLRGPYGKLASQTVHVGDAHYTTCFGWDGRGNVERMVDPAGFLTEFRYDLLDRPTNVIDPLREGLQMGYNAASQVETMMQSNNFNPNNDPANRTIGYQYDGVGNPTQQSTVNGDVIRSVYDPDMQMKAVIGTDNSLGTAYEYEGLGRIESIGIGDVNAEGELINQGLGKKQFSYDEFGRVHGVSDGNNRWTTFVYDALGRVEEIRYPDSTSVHSHYDAASRVTWREVRGRGGVVMQRTDYDYDVMDRITEVRLTKTGDPNVWKTTYTYQDQGAVVMVSQFLNNRQYATQTRRHDGLGRTVSMESPGTGILNYRYDSAGRLERLEDSVNGLLKRYQYDALGRLQFVRDGLDNIFAYQYDGLGDLSGFFRPGASPVQMRYSESGRIFQRQTGDNVISYSYDEAGRFEGVSYGHGGEWLPGIHTTYASNTGLPLNQEMAGQRVYEVLERDLNGNEKRWRNANGVTFSMDYDVMNRPTLLTAEKDGARQYRYWSYYDDGKVKVMAESVATPPDRFAEVRNPVRGRSVNRTMAWIRGVPSYDTKLKSVIYFAYAVMGNVVEENRWIQGRWLRSTTQIEGSRIGSLVTITYPSGFGMDRHFDQSGRLANVNGVHRGSAMGSAAFTYQPNGPRLQKIRFVENRSVEERYTYDAAGRMTQIRLVKTPAGGNESDLIRNGYKYSPLGNLIAHNMVISPAAGQNLVRTYTFGYDPEGRLLFRSHVGGDRDGETEFNAFDNNAVSAPVDEEEVHRFTYNARGDLEEVLLRDPDGYLTGEEIPDKTVDYQLRADGVPESADEGDRHILFDPDQMGNLQAQRDENEVGPTYEYDLFGRMVAVVDPAQNNRRIEFQYDPLSRVIARQVMENNVRVDDFQYIWDGAFLSEVREILTRNRAHEVSREIMISYLYGVSPNHVLASYDRRWLRFHHAHPDGSIFALTYRSNLTQWFRYTPYGLPQVLDWGGRNERINDLTDSLTLRLFGGALVDPLTGFHFLGGWYSPEHGRVF